MGSQLSTSFKSLEQPRDHRFLDLCSRVTTCRFTKGAEIKDFGVAIALLDVNTEDGPTLDLCGQIDKKDLVKTALSQQL